MSSGSRGPESLRDFRFVEFAARRRPGFRNCVVAVDRVPALSRRFGSYGCYATFYLYDEGIRRHARTHAVAGRPSVAGYDGPVYAPIWPLDIDDPDLDRALLAVRETRRRLLDDWEVHEPAIRVYFSGKKGFHVTVDTRAFVGPTPSRVMPEVLHRLTRKLAGELSVPAGGSLDLSLRDRVRLLRLPNTRHEGTGLYKIPLTGSEVEELGSEEIRSLAAGPRPLTGVDPTGLLATIEVKRGRRSRVIFEEAAAARIAADRPAGRPPAGGGVMPAVLACSARRALLTRPAPEGQRNNTAIRLASWLREAGLSPDAAEARLQAWNAANPEPLHPEELRHVVGSAYAHADPYHYGCRDPLIEPHCPADPEARGRCPYHAAAGSEADR